MTLRLLDKKEVHKQKAVERQTEIKEGAKLAQRVDDLRQLVATEEKNLKEFRDKTVKQVMGEISELTKEKDKIGNEIKVLEAKRAAEMAPLDAEWKKLQKDKAAFEERKEELYLKEADVERRDKNLVKAKEELEVEKDRISDIKETAKITLNRAILRENNSRDKVKNADIAVAAQLVRIEKREQTTSKHEESVIIREKDFARREAVLQSGETQLRDGERALQDRYKTFERTLKRHGR